MCWALKHLQLSRGSLGLITQSDGEHSIVELVRQTRDELPSDTDDIKGVKWQGGTSKQSWGGHDENDHAMSGNEVRCGITSGSPSCAVGDPTRCVGTFVVVGAAAAPDGVACVV